MNRIILVLIFSLFSPPLLCQNVTVPPMIKTIVESTTCYFVKINGENIYILSDATLENITFLKARACMRALPLKEPRAIPGLTKMENIYCYFDEALKETPEYVVSFKEEIPLDFNQQVKKCFRIEKKGYDFV